MKNKLEKNMLADKHENNIKRKKKNINSILRMGEFYGV